MIRCNDMFGMLDGRLRTYTVVENKLHGSNEEKHIFRITQKNIEFRFEVVYKVEGRLAARVAI